ncbi:MAG: hypothetical protein R3F03_10860 [Opitutaceae bacterium]
MPLSINTKDPSAVATHVKARFKHMHPGASVRFLGKLFQDITAIFSGDHPDYRANDLRYHDFEHTLQATVCLVALLEGRHRAAIEPRLSTRQTELAIASALLHDSGYQRHHSDKSGTSAKYTFMHVLRSCSFAATYLPTLGVSLNEISGVLGAIRCTGPTSKIEELTFQDPVERFTGCALATADYLGQMAAADYPDELGFLYAEFKESYDYFNVPAHERIFKSAASLRQNTPAFWRKLVLPKLEKDFEGVYRFLASPYPHGPNPYIDAVEANIAKIERRLARKP